MTVALLDEITKCLAAGKLPKKADREEFVKGYLLADKDALRMFRKVWGPKLPLHAKPTLAKNQPDAQTKVILMMIEVLTIGYLVHRTDEVTITVAVAETIENAIGFVAKETSIGRRQVKKWWGLSKFAKSWVKDGRYRSKPKKGKKDSPWNFKRNAFGQIILSSLAET
jgi:hypothetical protein